jgi:hypothetical protein
MVSSLLVRHPPVNRTGIKELFALASLELLNASELIQFGSSDAFGSVQ